MSAATTPVRARTGGAEPHRLVPPEVEGEVRPLGMLPFAFGRRFLVLLAFGFAWLAPAWWSPHFGWAFVAWDALLLAAWLVDFLRLPGGGELRVRRSWAGPLVLGRPVEVTLAVEHEARTPLRMTLVDGVPVALADVPPVLELRVPAAHWRAGALVRSRGAIPCELTPGARGDHAFEPTTVLVESPLRLAQRRLVARLPQVVRVFPELDDGVRGSLAAIRTRQQELARRRQRIAGQRREFEALRDWRDGDELRDVCWPATARRNRLVSKLWQAERSQTLWLVIDAGRLMGARVGDRSRLDVAVDAALRLARVAMAAGDRVGQLVSGRRGQQRVAPGAGRAHLQALLHALALAAREPGEADHLRAAEELLGHQRQRALVAWITDVSETAGTPDVVEGARHVARRHLLMFLALAHRELTTLAATTPEDVPAMYRRAAAQELALRRETLLRSLRQRGAMVLESEPGALATVAINGYLEAKERSRV